MILDIFRQTVMITSLVLIMMLIIEYFNIIYEGKLNTNIKQSKYKQVIFASLLGLVPGCIGGFAAVSMYTHNLLNFGALVANMIASLGDESFVILSMSPKIALILNATVFAIAVAAGFIINSFIKISKPKTLSSKHLVIHNHEMNKNDISFSGIAKTLRNISFQRAALLFGLFIFIFGVLTGQFGHGLSMHSDHINHEHEGIGIEMFLFAALAIYTVYILLRVDEHFLEEHLWEHIIKKHFLRIFLWTLGALSVITLLMHFVDIEPWMAKNQLIVLFIALGVGIIPESGPHLLFVTLYFSGNLPFSILLANSVVQDGHSALPLLAESKKSFVLVKAINLFIGLLVGLTGYFLGW